MKTTQKVSTLILNFNRAITESRTYFVNEYFFGLEPILDGIYKDGWIIGYKIHNISQSVEIFLKYDIKDKPVLTHVQSIWKPSLQPIIRIRQLASDSKNTAYTGIIRTAKFGFLTGRQALKNKTGGVYLAKFY